MTWPPEGTLIHKTDGLGSLCGGAGISANRWDGVTCWKCKSSREAGDAGRIDSALLTAMYEGALEKCRQLGVDPTGTRILHIDNLTRRCQALERERPLSPLYVCPRCLAARCDDCELRVNLDLSVPYDDADEDAASVPCACAERKHESLPAILAGRPWVPESFVTRLANLTMGIPHPNHDQYARDILDHNGIEVR